MRRGVEQEWMVSEKEERCWLVIKGVGIGYDVEEGCISIRRRRQHRMTIMTNDRPRIWQYLALSSVDPTASTAHEAKHEAKHGQRCMKQNMSIKHNHKQSMKHEKRMYDSTSRRHKTRHHSEHSPALSSADAFEIENSCILLRLRQTRSIVREWN